MEKKTISFIPNFVQPSTAKMVAGINEKLAKLRAFVLNHGEDFADVLVYAKKGADYRIRERRAECVAHLDKLGTPSYLRENQIREAVAALGAENINYWNALTPLLRVNLHNTTSSEVLNLESDVDVLPDKWSVKQEWIDARIEEYRVTVEDWQISDMEDFIALGKLAYKLSSHGYDMETLLSCPADKFPKSIDELDKEAFTGLYAPGFDERVCKPKKQ